MNQLLQNRRVIIDLIVEFPPQFSPEKVAGILQDYMKLNRFCAVNTEVQVSVYPINTRIVLNPISLDSNLNDIKQ